MSKHEVTHSHRESAAQKSAPTRVSAEEAAKTMRAVLARVSAIESMLNEARGSGVPTLMRNGAERAEAALVRIVTARERLEASLGNHIPMPMRELLDRAELDELQLRTGIARIRLQADDLDRMKGGPLSQLPQGELQTSPEGVRRQAMENAPPGLCDDTLMEGTIACPLDDALRSTNRELVQTQLGAIGDNWRAAIANVQTETRFKAMLKRVGVSPMRDMVLNLALGWVGGALVGAAIQKVASKRAVRDAMWGAAASLADMQETFAALGKYGGEKAAKKMRIPPATDSLAHLTASLADLATAWKAQAALAVRHLPDAALTALASGLKASPFTVDHFRSRLELLMSRYGELDKEMGRSGFAAAQTTTVWVVHPKGGGRMALAREEEEDVTLGHGRASDVAPRTTGRFVFMKWVDHSLESVALDIGRQRKLDTMTALTTTDLRWVDAGSSGLAAWHANPASRDDVAMFSTGGN